jgi:hypothetical protein
MDGLRDQRTDLVLVLSRHADKTTPETLLARESSDGSLSNDGNESDHLWASASLHAGLPKKLVGFAVLQQSQRVVTFARCILNMFVY